MRPRTFRALFFLPIILVIFVISSGIANATTSLVPTGPTYTMTIEAQWNPPYAVGAEPAFHIGVTIADILPNPIPGPVTNITYVSQGHPVIGTPSLDDVPPSFTSFGPNTMAERIGTTAIVGFFPSISVDYNTPLWLKNDIIDAEGNTITMYAYYPDGFTGTDDQEVTAYVLFNGQVHELVAPGAPSTAATGQIVSYTDNNVRMLKTVEVPEETTSTSPPSESTPSESLPATGANIHLFVALALSLISAGFVLKRSREVKL